MTMLRRVRLNGFRSIKSMDLELRPMNVLIGANGAGKSNLVSFFRMLNEMVGGHLQRYIAATGQAHSVLHDGPAVTRDLSAHLEFEVNEDIINYEMALSYAADDGMYFSREDWKGDPDFESLGVGHRESRLELRASRGDRKAARLRDILQECGVFHFHDTSATARVRRYGYVGDNRRLLYDAGNLAAVLLRLRNEEAALAYRRILSTLRLVAPFFHDFVLDPMGPNSQDILLNWRDQDSDQVLGPHQLSDGTLRAACLITLLLRPEDELPGLIVVDEPELGLHPYALSVVASLLKKASYHSQVLISTQSSVLLDHFDPEDVIVVDRKGARGSTFTRLDPTRLDAWLEDYSLGEVWEKNVVGGGPH